MTTGTDSDVQLPTNQSGPLVDTSQVATSAGAVQRQRVALGDALLGTALANVGVDGELSVSDQILVLILMELRALRVGMSMLVNSDLKPSEISDSEE